MASRTGALTTPLLTLSGLAFFILVLIGPVVTYNDSLSMSNSGSLLRQVGYTVTFLTLIYAVLQDGKGWRALQIPWPVALALAWCWLSLTWAINLEIAFQRLVLTNLAVWFAFILVRGAGYERSLDILRVVLVTALVGNYLTVLIDPTVGIHLLRDSTAVYGNWRGLMGHKNFAGAACAICIILFIFGSSRTNMYIRILVIAAATFFLFKSQSKTSGGMVAIAIIGGWVFLKFDSSIRRFAIPLLMLFSAAFVLAGTLYSGTAIQDILNPKSFTGRGYIWSSMLRYAETNWIRGSGFGSFWKIGFESPIFNYGTGFVREVAVGHNGYLDLLVTIGVPGLVLTLFAMIIWPTWKLLTDNISSQRGALAAALLIFCIGHNFTESSVLERDSFIGVMLMITIAFAQSWYAEEKGRARNEGQDVFAVLRQRVKAEG
jgi:O-antigen ligase